MYNTSKGVCSLLSMRLTLGMHREQRALSASMNELVLSMIVLSRVMLKIKNL
jgi:hypothetical protein